ncbi:MAG TPA: ABC transporter ATP-binding protein [Candidatus Sulfotelmatobacter sp.]|nr:ABC transporter ATP-binding protein [Candidatus Sulfotelmatobacter sp.]
MARVPALLEVHHLNVAFPHKGGPGVPRAAGRPGTAVPSESSSFPAVRDLTFSIAPGEVLGLVGESGSGKSVTSLAIMRLLPPQAQVSGEVLFRANGEARDLSSLDEDAMRQLRGTRIAMIFQEPMTALNPVMRVGEQIAEAVLAHNAMSKKEAWQRAVDAMNDVAIPDAARRARDYPHQLSGGLRQRIMIAMAIVNRPQLLIADEPTTALDVTIQAQILELLAELRAKFRLAMLFISHDLAVVSQVADRVAVMYAGSMVELGARRDIFQAAAHPYTRGLLHAVPDLKTDRNRPLETIEGTVPALHRLPAGCPFEPRCGARIAECARELPALVEVSAGHWARCPVLNAPSGL